jgi:hypothetical protein
MTNFSKAMTAMVVVAAMAGSQALAAEIRAGQAAVANEQLLPDEEVIQVRPSNTPLKTHSYPRP